MFDRLAEQVAVLALTEASPGPWWRTAAAIEDAGSALAIRHGHGPIPEQHRDYVAVLQDRAGSTSLPAMAERIEDAAERGVRLVTVLDDDYPVNLRAIHDKPPFLWYAGTLSAADARAIAVVGTRGASDDGLRRARRLTAGLVEAGVTVVSGLASGIDTAAHLTALETGGRTLAVLGHGILRPVYPKENRGLAARIRSGGAVMSQFWLETPPQRTTFPLRNAVTSGLATGTVVIEASATSGAKMQARLALQHGKRLFLLSSLVDSEDWARKYARRPGVTVVKTIEDVLGGYSEKVTSGGGRRKPRVR
ncbi:DNA-processing protein DprA [Fodinicola acaciae]|uniref:DNA-processing protein DprA n=1 Tax=Fodinicola acaciae TaxID=2681555 RepID=UPI0013D31CBB|nr:DNA-processing protein DprA [Fodinicola acaciae]